jgi:hypothetical protein
MFRRRGVLRFVQLGCLGTATKAPAFAVMQQSASPNAASLQALALPAQLASRRPRRATPLVLLKSATQRLHYRVTRRKRQSVERSVGRLPLVHPDALEVALRAARGRGISVVSERERERIGTLLLVSS